MHVLDILSSRVWATTQEVADELREPLPKVATMLRSMAARGVIDGGRYSEVDLSSDRRRPPCWWAYFGPQHEHYWHGAASPVPPSPL